MYITRSFNIPEYKYPANQPPREPPNYYYGQNMQMYQPNYPMMNPNPYYYPYYPQYGSET